VAQDPAHRAAEIMAKSAANLKAAHPQAITVAAKQAKETVLDELDRVASGRRLRNVGKKGGKLGVRYNLKAAGDSPSATVKATGPWQIIERDTKGHTIQPRKKGKRKALRLPNGGFRRSVPHPGTRGKHPWEKGVKASGPKVSKVMATRYVKAVGDAWS
jgi:hypothetical protein